MVSKITLNGVASYKKEAILETDKRVNLLYGLNGTGKSTFSEFLYNQSDARFPQCSIEGLEENDEIEEYKKQVWKIKTEYTSGDGVHIEPDLYSEKDKIICEIYAHIGSLKGRQPHKISQDILKMLLLEKSKGTEYRKIIVVADDNVEKYLNGKSFIAESIRQFGIEIKRVNLSDDIYESLAYAQKRQIMVNKN